MNKELHHFTLPFSQKGLTLFNIFLNVTVNVNSQDEDGGTPIQPSCLVWTLTCH